MNELVVVKVSTMPDLPFSCADCKEMGCLLPTYKSDSSKLMKKYLFNRHPGCPLRKVHPYHLRRPF